MTVAEISTFLRFAQARLALLDRIQPSAYGIFLVHYIFIIYLQYAVYDPPLSAFVKFAIVFIGTLSLSWATTLLLRKLPVVSRII
jgi:peptidoglycan/LPS O-acetylase OafA/YrhL